MRSTVLIYLPMITLNIVVLVIAIRRSQAEANSADKELGKSRNRKEK
jgi:hypothetical protein